MMGDAERLDLWEERAALKAEAEILRGIVDAAKAYIEELEGWPEIGYPKLESLMEAYSRAVAELGAR